VDEEETTPGLGGAAAALAGAEWPSSPPWAGIIGTKVMSGNWTLLQHPGYERPAAGPGPRTVNPASPVARPARPGPGQPRRARHSVSAGGMRMGGTTSPWPTT